jgi:glycosyltransferase involved in cell wall biosynthesis
MENIFDISVILPIKTIKTKDFSEFFDKCIDSLKKQQTKIKELVIVHTDEKETLEFFDKYNFEDLDVKKVRYEGVPSYATQINIGIKESSSEWVSFLEFDDEYSQIWFKNVKKYSEVYPDVEAFMPVVIDVDNKFNFLGFTNEATFAASFAQEVGYLTNDMLHNFQNFQTSGIAMKKGVLNEFGGFKESMVLTFVYEFLLRMTYNSVKIMTIPKIGYKHLNFRPDSIFWDYKFSENKLSENEVKFWLNTAKKEYFFVEDRNIKYTETV